MLDPNEPDTSTSRDERSTSSSARPTSAAGGKPAGRAAFLSSGCTHDRAPQPRCPSRSVEHSTEAEVATQPEKTTKKSAVKRTAKKRREETPPSEDEVVKTSRKRTAKKTVALATEATPDEAEHPPPSRRQSCKHPTSRSAASPTWWPMRWNRGEARGTCGRGTGKGARHGTCARGRGLT